MKYRRTARPLALAIASMLAFQPATALAVTFADINQVPWPGAEKSINKAADLKLVVGETKDGKSYFRPKDTVSLSESCQFVYKAMLQTKKANADASLKEKWANVMNTYKIQEWAHPAVSYCLENNIIAISDLSTFVKGEVNMPASREQAAEMLGRALTVGVPTYSANAAETKFNDNSSISTDARPYIALLNEAKIVNGDDLGNFNPKKTLNRTETAVMITNLYEKLNSAPAPTPEPAPAPVITSQKGIVSDINSMYVNFENSPAYYLYSSSSIPVTLNGETSFIDALITKFKEGASLEVEVTLNSDSRVTKMTATATGGVTEEVAEEEKLTKGHLTKVTYNEEKDTGYITLENTSEYFVKNEDVFIDIIEEGDDKNDKTSYDLSELKDLYDDCKKDDKSIKVELTLDKKGRPYRILGEVKNNKGDIDGTVKSVEWDNKEGEIKINSKTYDFDKDTDITINEQEADPIDLMNAFQEGKTMTATLYLSSDDDDDYVTDILIYKDGYKKTETTGQSSKENGKISEMTFKANKATGTITIGSDTFDCDNTDDVSVQITDGDKNKEIETWEDLYAAFAYGKVVQADVTIEDGDITKITGYVSQVEGRLKNFKDTYIEIETRGDINDDNASEVDKYKYLITENAFVRDPEDKDEEDKLKKWENDLKKISFDVTGIRNISNNLLSFYYDWMKWEDDEPKRLESNERIDLVMKLNKDGMVTSISGEYK